MKTIKLPPRLGIALTCGLVGLAQLPAAVEITRVLRNGTIYGVYRLQPLPLLGLIKFVLELPDETIDLEVWNAAP